MKKIYFKITKRNTKKTLFKLLLKRGFNKVAEPDARKVSMFRQDPDPIKFQIPDPNRDQTILQNWIWTRPYFKTGFGSDLISKTESGSV